MKVIDVCSGIGTTAVAWHLLGWQHLCFAEIEKFPSAVLRHRWPNVPNEGDFTKIGSKYRGAADLLVGGTPCQSFSVAGLRGGLADDRGNLALEFLRLADRTRPRWVVWENVPGVLSSLSHAAPDPCPPPPPVDMGCDGAEVETEDEYGAEELHAFNCFLAGLSELGYGWAYRVLDAQHFGVPQRRRRVFVVGHLGDWRAAAAVLFERHSLQGDHPPRREKGQGFTHDVAPCIGASGRRFERTGDTRGQDAVIAFGGNNTSGPIETATACNAHGGPHGRLDFESETFITHSLRADGFDASEDGTGRGTPIIPILEAGARTGKSTDDIRAGIGIGTDGDPMFTLQSGKQHAIAFSTKDSGCDAMEDLSPTLRAGGHSKSHANAGVMPAIAFEPRYYAEGRMRPGGKPSDTVATLKHSPKAGDNAAHVATGMAVRRLTPLECERLQGLPDFYTLVPFRGKPAADGNRYKAIGNGMAVPVLRWIGERIQQVEDMK